MLLEDKIQINGTYDSGSQVSLINKRLISIRNDSEDTNRILLRTVNGVTYTKGLIRIKVKIFDIEEYVDVFIVDKLDFEDFIIGLDMIKIFKLAQTEDLKILQKTKREINTMNAFEETEEIKVNFNEHVSKNDFITNLHHLDNIKKARIHKLIENHKTVFAKDKYDVGTVTDYEARIDLLVDKYCSKRPYRCTLEDKIEIEKQVGNLLRNNMIEESYSPFAAPVTLAFKRDENTKSRLCIDFRELNKIVIPQAQPFPLISDLIVKARNCKYFTTLDINSAFWSIPLRIEDRQKTGFVTQDGHYQWTCLPFGLKTSPAIFQRILSNILRNNNLKDFTENYIDDILIFSKSFEDHVNHIEKVLKAIKKEGFRLKFQKCTFAASSVKYLGHIIGNNTVKPLKDNLISIRNFPTPKTQKNIRQFLGKINFYHEYIPNGSILLDPLHRLLRKNTQFIWSEECEKSFSKIKNILCSQPVLEIFDKDLPITIYTDASLNGIGAILKQIQKDGKEKPVGYFSKKLNDTQKRKKAIYLECLAIKEAIKYWQYWLIGRKFTVLSDHKPLENLNIKARTDDELGELTFYLSQYDFNIKYIPGKNNTEADSLSRNPVLEDNDNDEEILKTVNLITIDEIKADQQKNEKIKEKKTKLIERNGILYKKQRNREKVILSEEASVKLIKEIHTEWCHLGINQMINKISPYYTAKNLTRNIKKICNNCETCIKNKSRGQDKYGLMSHLGPASKPFQIMSIDTIGGFGGQRSTKRYLHLLVDHFTRFAFILTSKTQNAADFIKLVKKVLETENIEILLADQYPGLNSKEFKDFLTDNDVKLIFTAVDTPFSNGLNERLNQTLVNKMRCKINETNEKKSWTTIARECIDKYNETEHSVTGFAPIYLLEGKVTSILPQELRQPLDTETWIKHRQQALERSIRSHAYNKKLFDKGRRQCEFNIGELVYVENGNKLNRKKMDILRIGPFEITDKISNTIYKINTGRTKKNTSLYHITKLIRMEGGINDE